MFTQTSCMFISLYLLKKLFTPKGFLYSANDILEDKSCTKEEGLLLKMNFKKAYNHGKWNFLDQCVAIKDALL